LQVWLPFYLPRRLPLAGRGCHDIGSREELAGGQRLTCCACACRGWFSRCRRIVLVRFNRLCRDTAVIVGLVRLAGIAEVLLGSCVACALIATVSTSTTATAAATTLSVAQRLFAIRRLRALHAIIRLTARLIVDCLDQGIAFCRCPWLVRP